MPTIANRLEELFRRWEEARRRGEQVSVEELCRDTPELVDALRQRIAAKSSTDRKSDTSNVNQTLQPPASEEPVPQAPSLSDDLRPGNEPVLGYTLVQRLGSGGYGEVWKALAPGGIAVALKFVELGTDALPIEQRALDVIKSLRHANLLTTIGSWRTTRHLVIGMELADRTLWERYEAAVAEGQSGIPRDELLEYLREAAKGIDFLNEPRHVFDGQAPRGVQHRDIKPQNILLVGNGVKVADFGLVRLLEHTVTGHTGSLTPHYAAPEFFEGHTSQHSDQYSLAVTYCHVRSGRVPFVGTLAEVMHGHLTKAPDLSMLPAEERPIVARALAKIPAQRWPNCLAFVNALRASATSERPVSRLAISPKVAVSAAVSLISLSLLLVIWNSLSRQESPRQETAKTSVPPPATNSMPLPNNGPADDSATSNAPQVMPSPERPAPSVPDVPKVVAAVETKSPAPPPVTTTVVSMPLSAAELAKQAREILQDHCHYCHGEGGKAEGGVNYVLDVPRLLSRGKLIAGNSAGSKLFTQIATGNMPKDASPLSKANIETLKRWIDAGAPDFNPPTAKREFISTTQMFEFMRVDLQSIDAQTRPLIRYFTFTHLYNANLSDDELETYRHGLSKLINSLSWASEIVVPTAIDPARTIFRLDIGDVEWSAATWERILSENPYGVTYDSTTASSCYTDCGTQQPFVRGDWFVARASVPPLYHDILRIPKSDIELENKLEVVVSQNLKTGRAKRAGFNGSGVSNNNRLVERHRSNMTKGAYWKSYDFGSNNGKKNLFANPAGKEGQDTFEADGGELIFSLPNGLQGYMLIDAKGQRIDKAPPIVNDPHRPDKLVVNGLSCMSCHAKGMIEKDDQIRAAVLGSPNGYSAEVLTAVKSLYPEKVEFDKLLAQDKERFAKAVQATGAPLGDTEPILTLTLRFEEVLDLSLAAAEAGVSSAEFVKGLGRSSALANILGALKVPGGTVQREVYLANFDLIVRDLKLGTYLGKKAGGTITPTPTSAPSPPPPPVLTFPVGTRAGEEKELSALKIKFCWCPPGNFTMGSPKTEADRSDNEDQVPVTLSQGFWLGKYEVTQGEWQQIMGTTVTQQKAKPDSYGSITGTEARHPMYFVNHDEATEFCKKLTDQERRAGRLPVNWEYRLPTEAQWEYACRAGTTTATAFGNSLSSTLANFDGGYPYGGASRGKYVEGTTEVGLYKPNDWGLCDMHGNVYEWCADWYGATVPGGRDPAVLQASGASDRVFRGGSWLNDGRFCRSAYRRRYSPGATSLASVWPQFSPSKSRSGAEPVA